jgi:hypothetical protein
MADYGRAQRSTSCLSVHDLHARVE